MDQLVVDASVAAGWLFEDEESVMADAVLEFLRSGAAVVPSLFWLETANLAINAQRRGRVGGEKVTTFFTALRALPVVTDFQFAAPDSTFGPIMALAEREKLTVYDAAYLELAQREQIPLATLDQDLLRAAPNAGVALFQPSN